MDIGSIRPYPGNPRDNSKSVERVAKSIKEFGFLQPIVTDGDGVILAGHTRYAAAQSLGLKKVPVIIAEDLTPKQARAYRLADNKVGEASAWTGDMLAAELELIGEEEQGIDMADFGFDTSAEARRWASWKNEKRCGLVRKVSIREKGECVYTTFFMTGKTGKTIEEIKADPANVLPFADNLCDHLLKSIGSNLKNGGWCLCTTPRRRHAEGFHFATEICREASKQLSIPFYENAVSAANRDRIHTDFTLVHDPLEPNVILYDDIITTGMTIKSTRELLTEAGHNVLVIVAIRNQYFDLKAAG